MTLNTLWEKYVAWFGARQAREKLILAVALVGGSAMIGYSWVIEPALNKARDAQKQLVMLPAETQVLQALTSQFAAQSQDPDAQLRAELARLAADSAAQSERFRVVEASLIPPSAMAELLDSLLKRTPGLALLSLKTVAPVSLLEEAKKGEGDAEKSTAAASAQLFKHGIELRVAGSYPELLAYVKQVESAAPHLIWGKLELKTDTYPRNVMTLTLFSISMDTSWLAI
jgi:MSHA biogenesis protein MshJ